MRSYGLSFIRVYRENRIYIVLKFNNIFQLDGEVQRTNLDGLFSPCEKEKKKRKREVRQEKAISR